MTLLSEDFAMKDIRAYTGLIYDLSGLIHKLRMKDIRMESGVKLNSAAMSLLNVVDLNPGLSVTDLSKRMRLTKSAISQMLKKLCALGLVIKRKDDGNDKNIYPELTELGKKTAAEYRQKHDKFYICISDLLNGYATDEQELIYRFLAEARETVKSFSSSIETAGGENDG